MAGGGVGEAMLIGAAVGAGTGGIMSAAQDKDPLEGALLGAAMGAAGGGIGSAVGGAASGAATGATGGTAGGTTGGVTGGTAGGTAGGTTGGIAGGEVGGTVGGTAGAGTGVGSGLSTGGADILATGGVQGTTTGVTTGGATSAPTSWGAQGVGQGFAPSLTNAQAYGAGAGGGIMGLVGNAQNQGEQWAPEQDPYTGSLSYFKYNPQTFRPSIAPGYADGGVASLGRQAGMYPQSQYDKTQFAVPSQMPVSREVIGSDYDARISPYTGDIPRYAGGGIGFVRALQPGGEFGAAQADIYGAQQNLKPDWLQRAEPGGFIGATVPGKMDYEDKQRAEAQAEANQQAILEEEDRKKKMWSNFVASRYGMSEPNASIGMASGGISSLGSYSDGGRMLRGPGDGMSDDIPGVIAGKQPARLADGEFVVPADVVSHLGNGSTDAGAKKLYSMMDNVRKARTGSKKQGRQIKADKYVPGMKKGGIAYYDEGGDTNSEAAPAEQPAAAPATVPGQGAVATGFQATGYEPSQQYSPYTMANRPSSAQPQYYGDIYQGYYPDYSAPGYTLAGNLGQWSNVAGEQARAAQPANLNQQVTQAYLQNLGRAPDTEGFNQYMQSGLPASMVGAGLRASQEGASLNPQNAAANRESYITGLYNQYLNRIPDQAGMSYWSDALSRGTLDPSKLASSIQNSPEAQVKQMYQTYLGRAPESSGLNYWANALSTGTSADQVRSMISGSPEARDYQARQNYLRTVQSQAMRQGGILSLRRA